MAELGKQARGAFVGAGRCRWELEQANLGHRHCARQPRFPIFYPRVRLANQFVGALVRNAPRMQLVADGTLGAMRHHLARLIFQSSIGFEAAKIGPAFVKPCRHPHVRFRESPDIPDVFWKIHIPPAPSGECFDFCVSQKIDIGREVVQRAAVKKNRRIATAGFHQAIKPPQIVEGYLF